MPIVEKTPQIGVAEPEQQSDVRPPKMHSVFIHNDDYTDIFFVVHILQAHFNKSIRDAIYLMEQAHNSDKAYVGKYPKDIAETKTAAANAEAQAAGFPLTTSSCEE